MLFRVNLEQRLAGIERQLDSWNTEADRFRLAAVAARHGEQPTSALLAAAEEAHDGLITLLEEMDGALAGLPAGHRDFGELLKAQVTAVALLESVTNSLEALERFVTEPVPEATLIEHDLRIAAE